MIIFGSILLLLSLVGLCQGPVAPDVTKHWAEYAVSAFIGAIGALFILAGL